MRSNGDIYAHAGDKVAIWFTFSISSLIWATRRKSEKAWIIEVNWVVILDVRCSSTSAGSVQAQCRLI